MKSILSVFVSIVLCDYINGQFIPLVAFHENLPAMYKTDKGWVVNDSVTDKITNYWDIVQFCKDNYLNHSIINAMPIFHKEIITNWCKRNHPCTVQDEFEVHPIQCIDANYSSQPIHIPAYCKLNIDQSKECLPFHSWKDKAKRTCDDNEQTLRDLQVIFPCKDKYMLFYEVEYICCSNKDEVNHYSSTLKLKLNVIQKKYMSMFETYRYNKSLHMEHLLFSDIKKDLEQSYKRSLTFLNYEAVDDLKTLFRKHDNKFSDEYKNAEQMLYKIYKHNYEAITNKFQRRLFDLDNIHIKRIINRSENICHHKNTTNPYLQECLKALDNVSKRLNGHYKRMLHLHGVNHREYTKFMESRLKHLYSKYLPLVNGDTMWMNRFHDQLQEYCRKFQPTHLSKKLMTIEQRFLRCKEKATLYIHNQEHNFSLSAMVGISSIIIFALVVVITVIAYKFGGHLFRRGTHNYVMRVVADSSQSSQSVNPSEVKLNLYENPIFNFKSTPKHIEKQGLIENMEN